MSKTIAAQLILEPATVATLERLGASMFPQLAAEERLKAAIQYAFSLSVHAIEKIDQEDAALASQQPQFVRSV